MIKKAEAPIKIVIINTVNGIIKLIDFFSCFRRLVFCFPAGSGGATPFCIETGAICCCVGWTGICRCWIAGGPLFWKFVGPNCLAGKLLLAPKTPAVARWCTNGSCCLAGIIGRPGGTTFGSCFLFCRGFSIFPAKVFGAKLDGLSENQISRVFLFECIFIILNIYVTLTSTHPVF